MSEPLTIGRYQFENLREQKAQFLLLDFTVGEPTSPWLAGSKKSTIDDVLYFLETEGFKKDHPIVLICENGSISMAAARRLEEKLYINVFVVEGGLAALEAN